MATYDDRMKVVRKLREYASWDEDGELVGCTEFGESVLNLLSCGDTERECFNALADLIEPNGPKVKCVAEVKLDGERLEKLVYDAAVELTDIDRDALLALADECGDASRAYDGDGHELTSRQFANVARRIREALGVES